MKKRKIYIAAPLFNEGERAFNERIDAISGRAAVWPICRI